MSGEQFCRLLKDLGYDGTTALSLDWMFDYEVTKPMLQWMVNTLKPGNVLTSEELQQWQKLQESDQTLELEDIAKTLAEIENPTDGGSLDALRERVAALERQNLAQGQKLSHILAQRDKMISLKTAEAQSIAQLENECRLLMQEEQRQSTLNAGTAAEVSAAVTNLVETSHSFLASEPLKAMSALRAAFEEADKTLSEEIARTIDVDSRKNPLGLTTGTTSTAESTFMSNNTELARLQQVYSLSEQRFLESAVALAGAEAAAEAAKQRKGKEAHWSTMDANALRTRLAEVQEQVNSTKQNIAMHTAKTLPALCREISDLQATAVLLADCEEKIARQRRYAEQHDIIVAHLQAQEERLEVTTRAVQREAQRHKANATLLSAVTKECVCRTQSADARAQKLQEVTEARLTDDRDAVDPRDTLLQALYRLLSVDPRIAPPYLSREQLLAAAEDLRQSVDQSQTELLAAHNEANALLLQTSSALTTLRPLLAIEPEGQALVPRTLQTSMAQLEDALGSFTVAMETLIKDRDAKKRAIDSSEELALERMLFVYFFTSPDTLRGLFENLDKRLSTPTN